MTLLRNTRSETEPPEAALNRGRAALLAAAAGPVQQHTSTPSRAKRARRFAIGGLSTVGAAALVAGLVLTDVVGFAGWRGGADAAAATVLEEASAAAITSIDPVVQPGQYLKVSTTGVHVASGGIGDVVASYQYASDDTLYRPADSSDDWVWVRGPQSIAATFGPASEEMANAWWDAVSSSSDSFEAGDLLRAPGGTFYGGDAGAGFADLGQLPRDPYRLLNYIYRVTLGAGPSPDTEALVYMADRLRIGNVPADLRAAMYKAAAMIPGVTFVSGEATLDGRTGVAIGRVEDAWGTRVDIIIDPDTGTFIGDREVLLRDQDGIPAGTALRWTSVTSSVVDKAPEGGSVCGKMTINPETGQC
ncbi:CU044_5270 family protein [Microbacterium oleivorans]|uniref:CU044_5270 family protein n=1 Tax=Microbacterium oleivorans TaxID=273677 RepID=A0A7D5F802_9MICO|nr:CU044_5270 family protein [Microbacterium oleivorans]QLD12413.1 CU044_5270 family protein [Microbacterium oleivorans]